MMKVSLLELDMMALWQCNISISYRYVSFGSIEWAPGLKWAHHCNSDYWNFIESASDCVKNLITLINRHEIQKKARGTMMSINLQLPSSAA